MKRSVILFLIFVFFGVKLYAQKKIAGSYDMDTHQFIPDDNNILIKEFEGGLAAFMIKGKDPFLYKTNKVGFIDTAGKIVIKPLYTNCSTFNGNFALVQDTLNRKAMINRSGKIMIPFAMQNIIMCENDLFIRSAYLKAQTISIVDSINHVIVPFEIYSWFATSGPPLYPAGFMEGDDSGRSDFYWEPYPFRASLLFNKYLGVKKGNKWAVINRMGKEIIPPKFDWIGIFNKGAAPMRIDKKYGITDSTGEEVIPPVYDNIALIRNNFAIAIKDKKSGVLTTTDKLLIPFQYDKISQLTNNTFLVDTGNFYGVIDEHNKTVIPLTNQSIEKFGSGYLVYKDYKNTAVFDSTGVQKTAYVKGENFTYPVWYMGEAEGCTVYNEKKREFIHYDKMKGLLYYEEGKWGLLDSIGTLVSSPKFDECLYVYGNHIAVKQNNKWGIINCQGKLLIPYSYDNIEELREQVLLVKKNNKYGILNGALKTIVPLKYDKIELTGYVNRYGNTSHDGLAVTISEKHGYFDLSGKEIVPARFDRVSPFQDGICQVMLDGKWGIYNSAGQQVLPCIYDYFNAGLLPFIVTQNNLHGVIDHEGKVIIPFADQGITTEFWNDHWVFRVINNGKVGLFDLSGKNILPFRFVGVQEFSSKHPSTVFKVWDGTHYGAADNSGKLIVPLIYDEIMLVDNIPGTSAKYYKVMYNGEWGFLNNNGKQVIAPIYSNLTPLQEKALIAIKNGRRGVIDWTGKIVVPLMYDQINAGQSGYVVQDKGVYGVIGLDGKEIAPLSYYYIDGSFNNVFFVEKDNKIGLMDTRGNLITPPIYDSYSSCSEETFVVTQNKLKGLIDYKGHVIYSCKYTFINCADGKVVEIY